VAVVVEVRAVVRLVAVLPVVEEDAAGEAIDTKVSRGTDATSIVIFLCLFGHFHNGAEVIVP
jgi:hypothetical protein